MKGIRSIIYTFLLLLFATIQNAQILEKDFEEIIVSYPSDEPEEYLDFINDNINNHYSQNYYWTDSCGERILFDELNYNNFLTSINAFNEIKKQKGSLLAKPYSEEDSKSITKEILKSSVERIFSTSLSKIKNRNILKEFLLPYRITDEPLTNWQNTYNSRFKIFQDSTKRTDKTVLNIISNINSWFVCTYGIERRKDPINHLSALQLLHRKKGGCEDVANLMVFALRSIGIPSSVDVIPLWGTTQGGHVLNSYFDNDCNAVHFDALSHESPLPFSLEREPAKVFRLTYSQNEESLAANIDIDLIPKVGLLRSKKYVDVTDEYWATSDLSFNIDIKYENQYLYASVFNGMQWRPVWYSKAKEGEVIFQKMAKGVVYITQSFKNNKVRTLSNPKAFTKNGIITFEPNKETHTIRVTELAGYLKFRTGKVYTLYYYDKKWIKHSRKIPNSGSNRLLFKDVPKNALLILRPEYSKGKERPFSIQDNGTRLWW